MIILFNNQPVTEKVKIKKALETAQLLYSSDFFDIENSYWFGDNLTIESLFPSWILKEYNSNPNNVFVIPIIKNYFRWLFSLEYGYGAQLEWENIRDPLKINSIFLESFSDFYFSGSDFSQEPLKNILPNIRKFLINVDLNYNSQKGTPNAIKHLMTNLLGFEIDDVNVYTSNAGIIKVTVINSKSSELDVFKPFLEEHVFPIGVSIVYEVI